MQDLRTVENALDKRGKWMIKNFSIVSTVEVSCDGKTYDLHSDYEATKFEHDLLDNSLVLSWRATREGMPQMLSIRFGKLETLVLRGTDVEMPRSEDGHLSFIGYSSPEDEGMDSFLLEDMADQDSRIIFNFEGGLVIKVYAEAVFLKVE